MIAAAALASVTAAAWTFLLLGAGMDKDHAGMSMTEPMARPWSPGFAVAMLVMWAVMMVAMMLPAAAPTVLLFDTMARRRRERGERAVATALFLSGYLTVWIGFAAVATALQYGLEQALLMSMAMRTTSALLAGAVLVVAGIYQLTPLKETCLRHCRSPLDFVLNHWREGRAGAFAMGVKHGGYCFGCCWMLMALLFVGGVMSLAWIGGLTLYVLAEKTLPAPGWLSRAAGLALVGWGSVTIGAAV